MDDRLERLEESQAELRRRLRDLEARLAALESQTTGSAAAAQVPPTSATGHAASEAISPFAVDSTAVLSACGRTLLVLGGAFLLRALTDSGTLRPALGVGLGLAYALVWIFAADRAATSGRGLSAGLHGTAFVLIALPLLLEATGRFHLLGPVGSAGGLFCLVAIALAVAARQRAHVLAWVATLGGLGAAVGLVFMTGRLAPVAIVLVLLGGITLWISYVLDWFPLRWPIAVAADLCVLTLGIRSVTPGVADAPGAALFVQILLLATFLGSVAARTLLLNRDVVPFEIVQSLAVIGVGLGGAAHVTRASGAGGTELGIAALVLGTGCYAVGLAFVERRQGRGRNLYFYTSAGLVFVMVGCATLFGRAVLALVWATLAVAAMLAGRGSGRSTFFTHASIYATAAAIVSGLVLHGALGLGLPVGTAPALSGARLAVLAACTLGVFLMAPGRRWRPANVLQRVPRLVLLVLAVSEIAGVLAALAAPVVLRTAGEEIAPGAMATLRTTLLVLAALLLAWAGTRRFVEGTWLVYPLLGLAGLKLVFHDLRVGRPATLFLAFGIYGLALILAPRLRKRSRPGSATTRP